MHQSLIFKILLSNGIIQVYLVPITLVQTLSGPFSEAYMYGPQRQCLLLRLLLMQLATFRGASDVKAATHGRCQAYLVVLCQESNSHSLLCVLDLKNNNNFVTKTLN